MSAVVSKTASAAAVGFAPIAGAGAGTLILGSLPSRQSLQHNQYYAHPRNAFWRIMGALVSAGPEVAYQERVRRLVAARIAVWDVLASSVRPGSLDADIDLSSAVPNDFDKFFSEFPSISRVAFNGKKAAEMFRRLGCRPHGAGVELITLPSTSPAFAAMPFEEKLARWRSVVQSDPASGMVGEKQP